MLSELGVRGVHAQACVRVPNGNGDVQSDQGGQTWSACGKELLVLVEKTQLVVMIATIE
jgi:hypothetical protein